MKYGTALESVLKLYDEKLQNQSEGRYEPIWSSRTVQDLVRSLNTLGEHDDKYQKILPVNDELKLEKAVIVNPRFIDSPLHAFHFLLSTDTSISNATETVITFESSWGDKAMFDFYGTDKSKIAINLSGAGQFNVQLTGMAQWASNATGRRSLKMDVYNSSDSLLGSRTLHLLPASNGDVTVLPISYTEELTSVFSTAAYFKLKVYQNSGGALNLENLVVSLNMV